MVKGEQFQVFPDVIRLYSLNRRNMEFLLPLLCFLYLFQIDLFALCTKRTLPSLTLPPTKKKCAFYFNFNQITYLK